MKNSILLEAYKDILQDIKIIRLATLTTIVYSIIFVIYIIWQVYYILGEWTGQWAETVQIAIDYISYLRENLQVLWLTIIGAIILGAGYFLLPPIADGALISYVDNKNKWWRWALWKWFLNFFQMFEYHAMTSIVKFLVFFVAVSRAHAMWILENTFVQILIFIWGILIFITSLFFHYSKFLIILKWFWPIQAIKNSIRLTLENFSITIKFVLINYLLYLRFFINIIILVFIPGVLIWISNITWMIDNVFVQYWFYWIFVILIMLTAYINWIIEAFFVSYWYRVYSHIDKSAIKKTDEM